jgi:hypothetical protein
LLSSTPSDEQLPVNEGQDSALSPQGETAAGHGTDTTPQRWGIMEACRRISAIRSVCDARTKAIRNRPEPRRDSETSRSNRTLEASIRELIGEESQ